jgi:hypothetical protein
MTTTGVFCFCVRLSKMCARFWGIFHRTFSVRARLQGNVSSSKFYFFPIVLAISVSMGLQNLLPTFRAAGAAPYSSFPNTIHSNSNCVSTHASLHQHFIMLFGSIPNQILNCWVARVIKLNPTILDSYSLNPPQPPRDSWARPSMRKGILMGSGSLSDPICLRHISSAATKIWHMAFDFSLTQTSAA